MAEPNATDKVKGTARSAEMRRQVSRRGLLRGELGKAGAEALRQVPTLAPFMKLAMKESPREMDERLVKNLWLLLSGRESKPEELSAALEMFQGGKTPDERADALVDVMWALTRTTDFEKLERPDPVIVRGLYRIALDRLPSEEEMASALRQLADAQETGERLRLERLEAGEEIAPEQASQVVRTATFEAIFTGLLRSWESVYRKAQRR